MSDEVIISDLELEHILQSLHPSGLEEVGGKSWVQQMSMFEELNVQAALEAAKGASEDHGEERVRDALVLNCKLPLVVHELLVVELWRDEVLPRMLLLEQPASIFQLYMILFNECNLANILETTLFHGPACESLDDAVIDLVDYCVRHLSHMFDDDDINNGSKDTEGRILDSAEEKDESVAEELNRHLKSTLFQIAMKSLSILRYLTDHLEDLTLSVTSRMVITYDVPLLMVKCLEVKPWLSQGRVFEGSDWKDIEDDGVVQKMEGQAWLALYNLLSKQQSCQKYEIGDYRRSMLLKLLPCINEVVEEQLPFMAAFKKWLLQLQLGAVPTAKPSLLIEPVAGIRDELLRQYSGKYDSLALEMVPLLLEPSSQDAFDEEISKLLQTFERDSVQKLVTSSNHNSSSNNNNKSENNNISCCVMCGAPEAKSRCSRCHNDRYCGRECQLKHWPTHKNVCCSSIVKGPKIVEL